MLALIDLTLSVMLQQSVLVIEPYLAVSSSCSRMNWFTKKWTSLMPGKINIGPLNSNVNTDLVVGSVISNNLFLRLLFYFAMKSHPVELRAEFHQFEPLWIVSSVFCCCMWETPGLHFSAPVAVLHSVHSSVTTMRTPLLLAIIIQCNSGNK